MNKLQATDLVKYEFKEKITAAYFEYDGIGQTRIGLPGSLECIDFEKAIYGMNKQHGILIVPNDYQGNGHIVGIISSESRETITVDSVYQVIKDGQQERKNVLVQSKI